MWCLNWKIVIFHIFKAKIINYFSTILPCTVAHPLQKPQQSDHVLKLPGYFHSSCFPPNFPDKCKFGDWTAWSSCTGGQQGRSRKVGKEGRRVGGQEGKRVGGQEKKGAKFQECRRRRRLKVIRAGEEGGWLSGSHEKKLVMRTGEEGGWRSGVQEKKGAECQENIGLNVRRRDMKWGKVNNKSGEGGIRSK